jgi:hypothetical protein
MRIASRLGNWSGEAPDRVDESARHRPCIGVVAHQSVVDLDFQIAHGMTAAV